MNLSDLQTGATNLMGKAADGVGAVFNNPHVQKVKEYLQTNPDLAKGLTAALAAGGAGAVATSLGGARYGETPGARRMRIIRNGLGAAAIGGAGYMALNKGLDYVKNPIPGNARDEMSDSVNSFTDGAMKYVPAGGALVGGAAALSAANSGMVLGNNDRTIAAMNSLAHPLQTAAPSYGRAFADLIGDKTKGTDTMAKGLKAHVVGQLRGVEHNFNGVDLDAIASKGQSAFTHAAQSVIGDKQRLADELINAHSVGGDRASGLAAVKRLLNEANVSHGAGLWQRTKQLAGGLADRSGASDLVSGIRSGISPGLNSPLTRLGLLDRMKFGLQDKARSTMQWAASKLPKAGDIVDGKPVAPGFRTDLRQGLEAAMPDGAARRKALNAAIRAQTDKATQQVIEKGILDSTGKRITQTIPKFIGPHTVEQADQAGVLSKAVTDLIRKNKANTLAPIVSFANLRKAIQATGAGRSNLARTGAGLAGAGTLAALASYLQSRNKQ